MKINKKILIPVFATAMGLSVIGGISGAVAWYQYNSKVTASFLGASVADTGVLQIGYEVVNDHGTPDDTSDDTTEIKWGRDFVQSGAAANLIPCTFGALGTNNALPAKAWAYPESGAGEGYRRITNTRGKDIGGWVEAVEGKHYSQFDLYFRAYQPDTSDESGYELVSRDIYLTDLILESVTDNKNAEKALRIHVAPEGQNAKLYADQEVTDLALSGGLDLDKNGHNDKYHATAFNDELAAYVDEEYTTAPTAEAEIVYGKSGEKQSASDLNAALVERVDGKIPSSATDKKLFSTGTDANGIKVTFTVWLEGWALLNNGTNESAIWNPYMTAGTDVRLGMQFDSGMFRESDIPQY